MSAFEATQAYGTAQLTALKLLVKSVCVLAALIAVGVSAWTSLSILGDEVFIQMWNVPLSSQLRAIKGAVAALTGYEQLALAIVAAVVVVVWVAAFAVLGALWTRYSRRVNIAASSLLLSGLALALLALAGQHGIVSPFVFDAIFAAARWIFFAAIVFTIGLRLLERLRGARADNSLRERRRRDLGGIRGGMADSAAHGRRAAGRDVCDERRLDTVASVAAAHDRRAGALVATAACATRDGVPRRVRKDSRCATNRCKEARKDSQLMTVHVSVRSISALLVLSVSLLGLPAGAPAQSVVAPQKTAPTLAERLDRLAAEFDRNRIDLHVPGAVLAIVRGEEVIFARGFGVADIEKKTPVTPDTPFFIGSTTKAFTATLVGMLVDEGRMQWDDPVEKYLPEFKLAVQSKEPNDRATLRDVLSHRTGFTRMAFLEINRGLSSDEILRRASSVEALAPFRQRFLYNNVHYLAAGSAAGVAAGTSWHALMQERILAPLGMTATRTSFREAWNDPRTARGYRWDEAAQAVRPVTLEMGINVDGVAPAGAISSTARDMTSWLRFLLRQGVHGGKALISPAALTTTWTPQIPIGGTDAYGLGWFVRKWQGQRLIEHGGSITGYSAEVGLLPDSNIGFVVLTNTQSALPSIATQLVPQHLLGELPPAAGDAGDLKPYLGRYIANFATFSNEVFTISERNGRLVLDIPSQLESALNPPRADGRWSLVMTDQLAMSFDRDNTGRVVGLKIHQGGDGVRGSTRRRRAHAGDPAQRAAEVRGPLS